MISRGIKTCDDPIAVEPLTTAGSRRNARIRRGYRRAPTALNTGATSGSHQHRREGVNLICYRSD
jgi:hypothetical protein